MSAFFSIAALAALAATANAHGTVTGIVADGTFTKGWDIQYYYAIKNGQEIEKTPGWYSENLDNGFIAPDAFGTADIICHKNAKAAAGSAKVAAGGKVDFQWSDWPASHVGPMITYVAKCAGDCADADKESLKWVKIDEAGYDGGWASDKMIANNNTWTVPVPSSLKAGNYVFRHETIALHAAGDENGAQNYPFCLNIEITGSGSDEPEGVVGTKLYTSKDDGIIFNPYGNDLKYTIPGPKLYSGAGSGSGSGNAPTPSKPVASPTASASATATATAVAAPPAATSAAAGSGSGAEREFTLETFIAWLEEQAGSSKKARRHARQFM